VTLPKNAELPSDRECRGSAQTIYFVWFLVKTNRQPSVPARFERPGRCAAVRIICSLCSWLSVREPRTGRDSTAQGGVRRGGRSPGYADNNVRQGPTGRDSSGTTARCPIGIPPRWGCAGI